ncbi:MAG: sensor histidine kinase [Hyphomicrobiaceae bacterium]|nr:sensor histidine kinase [Hyphomicrobiaceae bacterium]
MLVVMVGMIGMIWVDQPIVLGWATLVLACHVATIMIARNFLRLPRDEGVVRTWRNRFVGLDLANGIAWALLFLIPPATGQSVEVFQFAAMLIVVAVGVMLSSNIPTAMISTTSPIVVATAVGFASRGTPGTGGIPYTYAMAAMAIGVLAFFLILGYRLYYSGLAMVESRAEKDSLIAELEQAKAISDESRRKAEEANLAKSRFLATMSHELRTPLNAILGFSEVIKGEMLGPLENATYKDYVGDIHASGQHLLNLINEILDISRVEAGRYKLNEEAVTLLYTVEDCVHMMKLRAKNKGLTIVEQYEDNLPKIWADERAMRQIVLNVLSNAVKFTPAGGSITVKVGWTAGGGQYVSIKDTGPGIPEEEIPVVLSAFGQGSIAIKSAEQGTGLGLNIVQALVAMHDGTFDLRSKLREGTEITFTIPSPRVLEVMPAIDERKRRRPVDDNYTAKIWSVPKRQRA